MLPSTPLHLLALRRCTRPVVCTSGNRSDEPQVIDDAEVGDRLGDIADWVLGHDRRIHNRVDDSVVRVIGDRPRVLRRARGYAPAPLRVEIQPCISPAWKKRTGSAKPPPLTRVSVCIARNDPMPL